MKTIKRYGLDFSFLLFIAWAVLNIDAGNVHAGSCDDLDVAKLYPIAKDLPFVEQAHVKEEAAMDSLAKHNLMRTKELQTLGNILVTSANGPIAFRAPRVILKPGFKVECGSNFVAGLRTFDVHFINMVPETASGFFTEEWCRNEVDILNHKMANQDGDPLVRFRYKSHDPWDSKFSDSDFYKCISSGWGDDDPNTPDLCEDPNIESCMDDIAGCFNDFDEHVDNAINIIVYDNPDAGISSFANRNPGRAPFVVLNHQLVDGTLSDTCTDLRQDPNEICPCKASGTCATPGVAPCDCNENGVFDDDRHRGFGDIKGRIVEIHEMGHVFGLHHVQPTDDSPNPQHSISNIMYSKSLNYDENEACFSGDGGRASGWHDTELFLFEPIESFTEADPNEPDFKEIDYCQRFLKLGYKVCYWDDVNDTLVSNHDLLPDSANQYGQAEIVMSYAEFIAKNIGMSTW